LYKSVTIIPITGVKKKDTQKAIKKPIDLYLPGKPTIRERPNTDIQPIIILTISIKKDTGQYKVLLNTSINQIYFE